MLLLIYLNQVFLPFCKCWDVFEDFLLHDNDELFSSRALPELIDLSRSLLLLFDELIYTKLFSYTIIKINLQVLLLRLTLESDLLSCFVLES